MQGIQIAGTVLAMVLAMTTLSTMGFYAMAGADIDNAGLGEDDVEQFDEDLSQPEADAYGDDSPSNFGITTGVISTISAIWTLNTGVQPILENNGVPAVIAWSIQRMINFAFALAILAIMAGIHMLR